MRIALWIASPPTCSVRTPRASLTAMEGGVRFMPFSRAAGAARRTRWRPRRAPPSEPVGERPDAEAPEQAADADQADERHALGLGVAGILGEGTEVHHGDEQAHAARDERGIEQPEFPAAQRRGQRAAGRHAL